MPNVDEYAAATSGRALAQRCRGGLELPRATPTEWEFDIWGQAPWPAIEPHQIVTQFPPALWDNVSFWDTTVRHWSGIVDEIRGRQLYGPGVSATFGDGLSWYLYGIQSSLYATGATWLAWVYFGVADKNAKRIPAETFAKGSEIRFEAYSRTGVFRCAVNYEVEEYRTFGALRGFRVKNYLPDTPVFEPPIDFTARQAWPIAPGPPVITRSAPPLPPRDTLIPNTNPGPVYYVPPTVGFDSSAHAYIPPYTPDTATGAGAVRLSDRIVMRIPDEPLATGFEFWGRLDGGLGASIETDAQGAITEIEVASLTCRYDERHKVGQYIWVDGEDDVNYQIESINNVGRRKWQAMVLKRRSRS